MCSVNPDCAFQFETRVRSLHGRLTATKVFKSSICFLDKSYSSAILATSSAVIESARRRRLWCEVSVSSSSSLSSSALLFEPGALPCGLWWKSVVVMSSGVGVVVGSSSVPLGVTGRAERRAAEGLAGAEPGGDLAPCMRALSPRLDVDVDAISASRMREIREKNWGNEIWERNPDLPWALRFETTPAAMRGRVHHCRLPTASVVSLIVKFTAF